MLMIAFLSIFICRRLSPFSFDVLSLDGWLSFSPLSFDVIFFHYAISFSHRHFIIFIFITSHYFHFHNISLRFSFRRFDDIFFLHCPIFFSISPLIISFRFSLTPLAFICCHYAAIIAAFR
jgi:hypothetical protein